MPHLTEIQKKYAGQVVVTGLNIWEEQDPKDDSYLAKVIKYVEDFGEKMAYNVAADGPQGTIAKTWMEASEGSGIPTAFLVKDGTILWIGHPMGGMDEAIEKILAGTYDLKEAAQKDAQRRKAAREQRELYRPLDEALRSQDYAKAVAEIDKLVAKKPELALNLGMTKFVVLLRSDEAKAYDWAAQMLNGPAKDNPYALNNLAWTIVDDATRPPLKKPDFGLAVKIASRASDLTKGADPVILDTLAYAHFKNGPLDKAIQVQTKAIEIAETSKDFPAEVLQRMRGRLETMKAKKGGGGGE